MSESAKFMIKRDAVKTMLADSRAWTARNCTIIFGKGNWNAWLSRSSPLGCSAIYGRVTEEDIDNYMVKYRFCEAEKEDLLEFYSNYGGDLTNILEFIPYSDEDDVERYACWFSLQIQAGAIKSKNAFKPWLKSDVDAAQHQHLWEEGAAKLQKVRVSLPIALTASSLIITQEHKKRKASSGKASGEDCLVAALQSRALQRKQGFDALFAK
jgi:hypothetical protein